MDDYVLFINSTPILSDEDAIVLYQKMEEGDNESRNELITSMLPVAYKASRIVAKTFNHSMEELIGEANLITVETIDRWIPHKCTLPAKVFLTVKYGLMKYINENRRGGIKLTDYMRRVAELDPAELDKLTGARRSRALAAKSVLSVSALSASKDDEEFEIQVEDRPEHTPGEFCGNMLEVTVTRLLRGVDRKIFRMIHGLKPYRRPQTKEYIAREIGISVEEVKISARNSMRIVKRVRRCRWCGKHIFLKTTTKKYCGQRCRDAFKVARNRPLPAMKFCRDCKRPFFIHQRSRIHQTTCTPGCQGKPCLECGKPFKPKRGNVTHCSAKCSHLSRTSDHRKTERLCGICDEPFFPKTHKSIFCSVRCRNVNNARKKSEVSNPLKRCLGCNCPFKPSRSDVKYCTKQCFYRTRRDAF